ncbi:Ferredoxin--NADP reductase [Candidatus Lokiarchaeum ossiferum]|uniref:Ferredoxin--NADP reductase n=1 Tax=Candidatus Lokiarchaeum ossiferum TaxID=2951803 RepID=A0ABY6HKN0_9ARCH|nr:Ferredoxin--NADP reductase [Candidatus Lokiarchaeum sp. B-35]
MKSTEYSEKVLDHFKNPRNVGTLSGANVASGRVGNPTCGDIMEIFIEVKDEVIKDIKFKTFGCGSAVATSSMATVMVKGMTLDEALKVTKKDVANELDGLPPIKMHCSNLAEEALHEAIKNYREGKVGVFPDQEKKDEEEEKVTPMNIKGELDYLGKGLSYNVTNIEEFRDKRTLLLYTSEETIEKAIELTKVTGRVILLSPQKTLQISSELKKRLNQSDVKTLLESQLLEVMGEGEVEKVKILNLDEDETYELFIDALVILQGIKLVNQCADDDTLFSE